MPRPSPEFRHSLTVELPNGREVNVDLTFAGYYQPARLYGAPENCSPEDGEVTILTAHTEEDGTVEWNEWATRVKLTEADIESIEGRLMDVIQKARYGE
jgi:hypothetical protein